MMNHLFAAVFLGVVLSVWAAPSVNRNTVSELKNQMKNFEYHMTSLNDQFKSIFETIKKEKQLAGASDKRGIEISSEAEEKLKEKEMRNTLKDISKQLRRLRKQLYNLREKVQNMKESLGDDDDDNDDDDDDDDFDLDRREIKSSEDNSGHPECIKKSIVEEKDPFILKIALAIMKQVDTKESREYIKSLVNRTADHVIAKMNATHGITNFRRRLLKAVLELLKVRSILTIKTEGQFIDKLDERTTRTLDIPEKEVADESKVVNSLKELLKGPLAFGFVSEGQEKIMIEEAMKIIGKAFKLSKNKTMSIAHTMTKDIEEDVKENKDVTKYVKQKGKDVDDEEKIKKLQTMVADSAKKNNMNTREMQLLVKGLVAAIAARNKLSENKTTEAEEKILKGAREIFEEMRKIEKISKANEETQIKNFIDNHKDIPVGFKEAYDLKHLKDEDPINKPKKDEIEIGGEEEKRTILKNLKELEQLTVELGGHVLPHSLPTSKKDLGDKGDQVIIEAATNTRGSTRIIEHHNGKRNEIEAPKETPDQMETLQQFIKNLEGMISRFKSKIPNYNSPLSKYHKKTHEKVVIEAAKGTLGERKLVEGYKRKRFLGSIIRDAIALIKSLKASQDRSILHAVSAQNTSAVQATIKESTKSVTKMVPTEKPPTEKTVTETLDTEKVLIEKAPTKMAVVEELGEKSKKSEVSDAMEDEIKKAEVQIQKELEDLQRKDEAKLTEEQRKEKESQRKEKEREKKQKQEEKEREEKEKQKEKKQNEKERKKQQKESEKEKAENEEKEEVTDKKDETPGMSEDQIEADVNKIEKELEGQTSRQDNFLDKLKKAQKENSKPKSESTKKDDDLIKELDELFAKT